MYNIEELNLQLLSELKEVASTLKVKNIDRLTKQELIYKILDQQAVTPEAALPQQKVVPSQDIPAKPASSTPVVASKISRSVPRSGFFTSICTRNRSSCASGRG